MADFVFTQTGLEIQEILDESASRAYADTIQYSSSVGAVRVLTDADNGQVITLTNATDIDLVIDIGLLDGFNCVIIPGGAGLIIWSGTATVVAADDHTKSLIINGPMALIPTGIDTYNMTGKTQL